MSDGTIRSGEAQSVIRDLLIEKGVPPGTWSFKGRSLHLLIGSRQVSFACHAGLSFYGLQALQRQVLAAIEDQKKARSHRNQVDIEELIAAAP
jgi:hypothetical protein